MKFSPIFTSIMTKIKSLPESEYDSPTGKQLFRLAHRHAPPAFNNFAIRKAQAEGCFPKPTRCDENGETVYFLEEIAEFFGKTQEEAQQAFNEMIADDPTALDFVHQGATHVIQ
jgi:hypothetical protein